MLLHTGQHAIIWHYVRSNIFVINIVVMTAVVQIHVAVACTRVLVYTQYTVYCVLLHGSGRPQLKCFLMICDPL